MLDAFGPNWDAAIDPSVGLITPKAAGGRQHTTGHSTRVDGQEIETVYELEYEPHELYAIAYTPFLALPGG